LGTCLCVTIVTYQQQITVQSGSPIFQHIQMQSNSLDGTHLRNCNSDTTGNSRLEVQEEVQEEVQAIEAAIGTRQALAVSDRLYKEGCSAAS